MRPGTDRVFTAEDHRLRSDYATGTWAPKLTRQIAPDRPVIQNIGFEDGTLQWRGNAGFDRVTFGFNGQFYNG
jgi:hypothetical protein